ncbi:MAG TPA: tetratricopeptide repeat protein [Candidatus Limnocylindria bacterium]|nr:tetratricopeptide repeat protein [Candidatus Limnocylindria bacterium]
MADARLPRGTVTLLFTDIEGSTQLLERLGDGYAALLDDHHRILGEAAEAHGGSRVDAAGDGLFYSFPTTRGAVAAALGAQRALTEHAWPSNAEVRVRMGIHTGEPMSVTTGYVGIDVHRAARICSAGHGGQILVSEAVHALIGGALPQDVTLHDLGPHRLRGLSAPERLYQVLGPGLRPEFPPVRSLDTLPNNLPRQLSSFVGRTREITDAEARLREATILTLTGPGGVGKTRLAIEIGAQVVGAFEGGVWLVELGSITEGELVVESIASALNVKPHPNAALLETLIESLADKPTLLILDNCEHLLDAVVAAADELLRHCARLQLLATSREALGLPGESLMPVPSMSLPLASVADDDLLGLAECDAVRLFVDRARAVTPGYALTAENAPTIAQICRRLDGIPLAVELAAARIRSLPAAQIAARLDGRFRLLTGGSRTSLPRHRTLRAAFDWSFDLLSPAERSLLLRLSVFGGTFSLAAAEAICSGGAVGLDDMLDLLGRLVDQSLLQSVDDGPEARFGMLETIAEYAEERLAESGEAAALRVRHRDWFVDLVEEARPAFFSGAVQPEWIVRLARDHDNLRAALRWAHEDPGGANAELELASGLWRFWEIRGDLAEGRTWLERALARVGGEVSSRRANALTGAGVLAAQQGDFASAAAFHDASLLLYRELGNPLGVAAAASNSASVAVERGDLDRARQLYLEGIQLARDGGDARGVGFNIINLADVAARQGDGEEADRLYAESVATFETVGDHWGMAHATAKMAQAAQQRGDRTVARAKYQEAIAIHQQTGDRHAQARLTARLADLAAADGDFADAEQLYQASIATRGELGDRVGVAAALERLAGISEDRPRRAAMLLGAAAAIREAAGASLSAANAARVEQFLAELGATGGGNETRAAFAEGRSASWGAILERAAASD